MALRLLFHDAMHRPSTDIVCSFAPALAALALAACAPTGDEAGSFAQTSQGITLGACNEAAIRAAAPTNAQAFFDRALDWVHRAAPYSQDPQAAYGGYRTDCSGLVSVAWGLPAPGHTTYSFAGGPWDDHASRRLGSNDELTLGDAVTYPGDPGVHTGHIRLFAGWLNDAHTQYCSIEEYDYGHPAEIRAHAVDSAYLPIRLAGWTPVAAEWGAGFVAQSFPYASSGTVQLHPGESTRVWIELRNTGTHAWDSNTRLAPTGPRDRASGFASDDWVSPTRAAAVDGTVAPGGTYRFAFTLTAAATMAPGRYDEHWGVVQESVAWFSDDGQAGPPDDQLEGVIEVLATADDADAGTASDASATSRDGGSTRASTTTHDEDGGTAHTPDDGGTMTVHAGCDASHGSASDRRGALGALGTVIGLAVARRRRARG